MATWSTRGLRGSALEDYINRTNDFYRRNKLALIQKIPTPITPVKIDKESRHITLAYFEKKSTVDYVGVVQGIPVCFDAKECDSDTFPLHNVHEHQIDFMRAFEEQKGLSFLLVFFHHRNCLYYMRFTEIVHFWERMANGGRKSIKYDELNPEGFFQFSKEQYVPYLNKINWDLEKR